MLVEWSRAWNWLFSAPGLWCYSWAAQHAFPFAQVEPACVQFLFPCPRSTPSFLVKCLSSVNYHHKILWTLLIFYSSIVSSFLTVWMTQKSKGSFYQASDFPALAVFVFQVTRDPGHEHLPSEWCHCVFVQAPASPWCALSFLHLDNVRVFQNPATASSLPGSFLFWEI